MERKAERKKKIRFKKSSQNRGILVFGGAFDPVHKGHLCLLKAARKKIRPMLTLIVPSADHPVHKLPTCFSARWRLRMLNQSLRGWRGIKIIDFEIKKGRSAYAWETLRRIHAIYPRIPLYFLVGSDNLGSIVLWKKAEKIIKDRYLIFMVGQRTGQGLTLTNRDSFKNYPRLVKLSEGLPPFSSCQIRQALFSSSKLNRDHLRQALPPSVFKMLLARKALPLRIQAYLRSHLPKKRYKHTLQVARLATELARRHGVSVKKAWLAAMLHDASRTTEKFISVSEALGHGAKSARIAKEIFGIKNQEILEAIACHTVGRPGMKKLAQLIYVADLASYDRGFKEAGRVRRAARADLKNALVLAIQVKLAYLYKTKQFIHPRTTIFLKSLLKDIRSVR